MNNTTPKPAIGAGKTLGSNDTFLIVPSPHAAAENLELQLLVYQTDVVVDTDDTYTTEIKLPPVAEAAGRIYTFRLRTDGNQDVTISPYDDGSVEDDLIFTDITLDDAGDGCVLYSNGVYWFTLASGAMST